MSDEQAPEPTCDLCEAGEPLVDEVFHDPLVRFDPLSEAECRVYCSAWVGRLTRQGTRVSEVLRSQGRMHGHRLGVALSTMERSLREAG